MTKFNEKSVAVGIGIGLIIAAVLNIRVDSKPIPLNVLEEQAQKYYGRVLVPEGFENPTVTPVNEITVSPTVEPTAAETPVVPPTAVPTKTPIVKPTSAPGKTVSVSFTVTDYSTSETVANWLAKDGIVDKSQFLNEINRRGLSTKIRNGNYTFKKGTALDQIIKTLTGY